MSNRPERKVDLSKIKYGIKPERLKQLGVVNATKVESGSQIPTKDGKPEPGTLEWFDDRYAVILRRRNKLILQGESDEAQTFYHQMKNEFDRRLREHPDIRKMYYEDFVGIDLTNRAELNRFGWIAKMVDGNTATVKLFKT